MFQVNSPLAQKILTGPYVLHKQMMKTCLQLLLKQLQSYYQSKLLVCIFVKN